MSGHAAATSFLRWREIPASIWALGVVSLLMDLSSEMIHTLLPLYLVTVLGTSVLTVGVIEGIAEATASIMKIFSGVLSDYLGKRKIIAVLGYGLSAVTKLVFPLATGIAWLTAARFVDRVGKGIRGAPRDALVADLSPPELRGTSFGLRQSLDTVGAVLGPLVAIVLMLATANHFTLTFWVAVVPAFAAVAVLVFAVREPARSVEQVTAGAPLSRAALRRLGAGYWLVVTIAAAFALARFSEAFLLLRAQSIGVPLALVPMVMVVMSVVYAFAAWPAGELSDRIGRFGILTAGFAVLAVADLVLALGDNVTTLGIGVALWGLHMGLTQGLLATLVADTAPVEQRGTAFGLFNLVSGLALLAASVIAGALWDTAGPRATFLVGALFTALALAGLPLLHRFIPQESANN